MGVKKRMNFGGMTRTACGVLLAAMLLGACEEKADDPPSERTEQAGKTETMQEEGQTGDVSQAENSQADTSAEDGMVGNAVKSSFPTIYADVPDLDIIRIGEVYYMVSTTMNLCPGVPVMKSTDLVHWEIVNYVYDIFEDDDITNLRNGQDMYGRGSWAASLKYDEGSGLYYVAFCSNNHGFYVYTTNDIENGTWVKHSTRDSFHDPALFLEDGKLYVISASGGTCRMQELTLDDATNAVKKVGSGVTLFTASNWGLWEGAHAYKIDDYYYVFVIASPTTRWMRTQLCYRSKTLAAGDWEEKTIYQAGVGSSKAGLAQGGVVSTQNGDWYAFMFQDMGAVGRSPSVISVKWEDGWPMLGVYNANGKFNTFGMDIMETLNLADSGKPNAFIGDDEFDYSEEKLSKLWQWNHNPQNDYWSVTERPGFYRLKTDVVTDNVWYAHNSLTQRTVGPECQSETKLYTDAMKPGDYAGMCAVADNCGMIGVYCDDNGDRYLFQANGEFKKAFAAKDTAGEKLAAEQPVWLKIEYKFRGETASFYYSLDGENWTELGQPYKMGFSTSTTFMGARSWLCNFATKTAGGYVDFDYYKVSFK